MTIGLEEPRPGTVVFQTMFFESLQVVGVESDELALPAGPRNCGQSSALDWLVRKLESKTAKLTMHLGRMENIMLTRDNLNLGI